MKFSIIFKSNRFLLLMLIVIGMHLNACKKLIDIPSNTPGKISTGRVYSDSANVLSALVGLYANFKAGGYITSINGGTLSVYTGLSADELLFTGQNKDIDGLFANNILLDNQLVNEMWVTGYQGIYQANAFLEGVTGNSNISAAFERQARGEALLTRALYYFNLVNIFGKVPIVTETDFHKNAVLPRSPESAVYDLIIADLNTSISLLNDKYPTTGRLRPNVNAARSLLSRVYLYRGKWKEASDMAGLVINSGLYDLVDVNGIFLDGSREAIWQVLTLDTYAQTAEAATFIPAFSFFTPSFVITNDLKNSFEPGDRRFPRWVATIKINNVDYSYPTKYRNLTLTQLPLEQYMMFRIGEQYLIRSEALAQQDLLDQSSTDLNKIRSRAGLAPSQAVTKDELLNAIAKERRIELFCEWGHRWFDLKRTGKANSVLSAQKTGWDATDALYPVPLKQRNSNPFLDQNPGYPGS